MTTHTHPLTGQEVELTHSQLEAMRAWLEEKTKLDLKDMKPTSVISNYAAMKGKS